MFNRTVNYAKAEMRHYKKFEKEIYSSILTILSKITKENKKSIESYIYSCEIKPDIKLDMTKFDNSTKEIINEIDNISSKGDQTEIKCIIYLLMNHHPLTLLTGADDEWLEDKYTTLPTCKFYINKRFTSLKRLLMNDGTVKTFNCNCLIVKEDEDIRRKGKLVDKFPYAPEPIKTFNLSAIPEEGIDCNGFIKEKTNYNHYNVFKKLQGIKEY